MSLRSDREQYLYEEDCFSLLEGQKLSNWEIVAMVQCPDCDEIAGRFCSSSKVRYTAMTDQSHESRMMEAGRIMRRKTR